MKDTDEIAAEAATKLGFIINSSKWVSAKSIVQTSIEEALSGVSKRGEQTPDAPTHSRAAHASEQERPTAIPPQMP
jgi:hypothetical protein